MHDPLLVHREGLVQTDVHRTASVVSVKQKVGLVTHGLFAVVAVVALVLSALVAFSVGIALALFAICWAAYCAAVVYPMLYHQLTSKCSPAPIMPLLARIIFYLIATLLYGWITIIDEQLTKMLTNNVGSDSGFVHIRILSSFVGFPDDMYLGLSCNATSGVASVSLQSQARLGKADAGHNQNHVAALLSHLYATRFPDEPCGQ
ncbi:uncharacterized protein AMSG_09223 [Thecamonas trahens ATCC 50062]|uniref:Uncharacterized protein n=1 Tax=Thecamonas trahens ATCC 50062 TaxID=461836 RepID=A0A0L0DMA5_THETB|nr:hypothetical protein AMSG_09223 [Thecamonas trahens ATCC 50062]KNC53146.1 hypothetical protein AMSG_09223 [Thecamonas trahens ATCC 50062]|eukprot:XP_013754619.1 hypothetical protein AMSG_09223 [Thecamonas trahens ATCC 50062]